jgi:hypothetical protein
MQAVESYFLSTLLKMRSSEFAREQAWGRGAWGVAH